VIIDSVHFTQFNFGNWTAKNILGDQVWVIDSIHGVNQGACAKISGFANSVSNINEDWFITKSMNFNLYNNENLTFMSAYKYTGPPLQCLISNDYDGVGNPGNFSWLPLTATWSSGNWVWTPSGNINISGVSGPAVYVAFKYTSTATESSTWELDDIIITGDLIIGVDEHQQAANFSIQPNPAEGKTNLVFSGNQEKRIQVLTLMGQNVLETTTTARNFTLDLDNFNSGIYFVKVSVGQAVTIQKLIVR
jgi:hypothetical protein